MTKTKRIFRSFWPHISVFLAVLSIVATIFGIASETASAATTTESLWPTTIVPKTPDVSSDSARVSLGTKFESKVAGKVTGMKFYKGPGNTGSHVGTLYSSSGTKLASGIFTNETASGWQSLTFATPVNIVANKIYVISYFDPHGNYADDQNYFSHGFTSKDLIAPANAGVYNYGYWPSFPNKVWNSSNYWVDINFVPAFTPSPTTTTISPPPTATTTTVPPTTTNTVPPTTTTQPVTTVPFTTTSNPATTTIADPSGPSNWPTANNTGASGTLTDQYGSITLDTDGQVLQNVRLHGDVEAGQWNPAQIYVTACNVTINNVELDTGEPYTGDTTPDLFAIWLQVPANCSTTITNVSVLVDTSSTSANPYATEAVRDAYGSSHQISGLKAVGVQLGVTLGAGVDQANPAYVKNSYIELGPTMRGDHNEDILEDGTTNILLQHNTFLNQNGQTSALSLFNEFGSNSNFLIQDNLMAGGGYTCYCGDGVTAPASNVSFINNVFWELYFPTVGQYAPGRAYNPAGGGQWTNNVYMLQDGTLTTQQVPQPPLDGA